MIMIKQITWSLGLIGLVFGLISYILYKKDIKNNIEIDRLDGEVVVLTSNLASCNKLKESQVAGCFKYIENKKELENKYNVLVDEYKSTILKAKDVKNDNIIEILPSAEYVHREDAPNSYDNIRRGATKRLLCEANLAEEYLCKDTI